MCINNEILNGKSHDFYRKFDILIKEELEGKNV
jgi:hypothetical protein